MRRIFFLLVVVRFGWGAQGEPAASAKFTVAGAQSYLQAQAAAFQIQAGTGAEADFVLARLQNRLGRQDEAERLAREAAIADPNRADIHSFLGKLLLAEGHFADAASAFRKALELNPKAQGDYRRLGMVLDQLGDHDGARKAFSTAINLAPTDATAHLMLGRMLLDQGDAKEAVNHLERARQLDATLANAYYVLSQAQSKLGNKDAAEETRKAFQRLREKEEASLAAQDAAFDNEKEMRGVASEFHTDAAAFFFRQGRNDLVEAHLKKALEINPSQIEAVYQLARIYLAARRDLPEALALCRRCVRLQPTAANYDLLAQACYLSGQKDEARTASARAVELDPNQAAYREHNRRFNESP